MVTRPYHSTPHPIHSKLGSQRLRRAARARAHTIQQNQSAGARQRSHDFLDTLQSVNHAHCDHERGPGLDVFKKVIAQVMIFLEWAHFCLHMLGQPG
jgi:hypothetical protein